MRKLALLAAAAFAATAVPAAATTVVYNGTNYTTSAGSNVITINFTGVQNPSAHADLVLTFLGANSSGDYMFTYALTNTSTAPSSTSNDNVPSFGFDITSTAGHDFNLTNSTVTADAGSDLDARRSGSISGGFQVDFCATSGNNCAGGQNEGPRPGETQTGSFVLAFAGSDPGTITITNPLVRFQNTSPIGSDVGQPSNVPGVPEPGTWAMMLLGFGAIGFAMRRRRQPRALAQLA